MILLAAAWGLAEATLFFVVPDVLVSVLALKGLRPALLAALAAALGAVAGAPSCIRSPPPTRGRRDGS